MWHSDEKAGRARSSVGAAANAARGLVVAPRIAPGSMADGYRAASLPRGLLLLLLLSFGLLPCRPASTVVFSSTAELRAALTTNHQRERASLTPTWRRARTSSTATLFLWAMTGG